MSIIQGSYTLGISEKPQAARRIARAIDENSKPESKKLNNVPVYVCHRAGKKIVIVPAIGHLLTLDQIGGTWNYPTLDFEWVPTHIRNKRARTANFVKTFNSLKSKAKKVIIMTDYDREGEVIGYLILKYLLDKDSAERMKFSTLTKRDVINAYENREKKLDINFLHAGLLRHYVDWLYGINFSRALSLAYQRVSNRFKTISIGRVQGPTLSFIVEKERKIDLFVPIPFWKIQSEVKLDSKNFNAEYETSVIETLKQAQQIVNDCHSLEGQISDTSHWR